MMKQLSLFDECEVIQRECSHPDQAREVSYVDRVRESMNYYNVESNDLQHLIAVIIGRKATPELCGRIASIPMRELVAMSYEDFNTLGVSKSASYQLVAALGLASKVAKGLEVKEQKYVIRSPKDAADLLMPKMRHLQQEHFVCIFLDTKNQVIGEETIFVGSLNSAIVHPREIFTKAVRRSCASIIVAHNHRAVTR